MGSMVCQENIACFMFSGFLLQGAFYLSKEVSIEWSYCHSEDRYGKSFYSMEAYFPVEGLGERVIFTLLEILYLYLFLGSYYSFCKNCIEIPSPEKKSFFKWWFTLQNP